MTLSALPEVTLRERARKCILLSHAGFKVEVSLHSPRLNQTVILGNLLALPRGESDDV